MLENLQNIIDDQTEDLKDLRDTLEDQNGHESRIESASANKLRCFVGKMLQGIMGIL